MVSDSFPIVTLSYINNLIYIFWKPAQLEAAVGAESRFINILSRSTYIFYFENLRLTQEGHLLAHPTN